MQLSQSEYSGLLTNLFYGTQDKSKYSDGDIIGIPVETTMLASEKLPGENFRVVRFMLTEKGWKHLEDITVTGLR